MRACCRVSDVICPVDPIALSDQSHEEAEISDAKAVYVHSKAGEPTETWHRLDDHLRGIAGKARDFAAVWWGGRVRMTRRAPAPPIHGWRRPQRRPPCAISATTSIRSSSPRKATQKPAEP